MRVKICGVCRPADARMVESAGADYMGVILSPGHARSQEAAAAGRIFDAVGSIRRAGVFVDADVNRVATLAQRLRLNVLQLHGTESPGTVAALREAGDWHVWKALRPHTAEECVKLAAEYADVANGLLLDGWAAGTAGGAGAKLPWEELARVRDRLPAGVDIIVAGGLTAANVKRVIELLSPDIVDVSSGVESSRGVKSEPEVRAFVAAARAAAALGPAHE